MTNRLTTGRRIPASYRLSSNDQELGQAMQANMAAGFFAADCDPAAFYDKCVQHLAVCRVTPDLAFDGRQLTSLNQLPADDGRAWVVRPALSVQSRGSALLLWGDGISDTRVAELFGGLPGPFQIHAHETGDPVFINGVFEAGQFDVNDAWRCHTLDMAGRRHLTAVTSLNPNMLPAGLVPRLAELAAGLGMLRGPLHAEVVINNAGARLVKLSPRLASTPLPQLCQFAGWPTQKDCWQQVPRSAREGATQEETVADYSFLITRSGRLKAFRFDKEVRGLASFSHYFAEPSIGQRVAMTTDGTTYGCTVFLRSSALESLHNDIARLQTLNLSDAFEFE